ncbi:MAG: hypothetical protein HMLIMOIP_002207 [Candidatus Nitrosomirales archaeon]|jgi:hypothetical protein
MIGKALNVNWRVVTAILAASTLLFSTLSSTAYTAFADESSAKLKALPKKSLVDDGNSQLLELKFKLEEGDTLELIRITVDGELVVEFDAAGTVLDSGPSFELVFGSVTMLSDGYYAIGKAKGKFVIAMDKLVLGVGDHEALAEVVLDGETLTATAEFTLKPSSPPLPDLVAKHFFAPTTIMKNRNYMTFTIETNEGSAKAKEHKVKVYLSEDDELGSGDKVIGEKTVEKLKAGWFKLVPVKIKVPNNTDNGDHNLIVKVDATDKIQEISEENNTLSRAADITSGPSHHGSDDEDDD